MDLGSGEYLIISTCLKSPYNYKNIYSFLSELGRDKIKFKEACFLEILPHEANYDLIWNGEVNELNMEVFSKDKLENHFLSSVGIVFYENILARLQVSFLDETSYEVSLVFNYTQLISEELLKENRINNATLVENVALIMFEKLTPVYGMIGVEKSVGSINSILSDEESLPVDKAFYSQPFINLELGIYEELICNSNFIKVLEGIGVYFRKEQIDDFNTFKLDNNKYKEIHLKAKEVFGTLIV